jgi:hypothetical protein
MVKAMKMVLKVARTTSNWLKEFLVFCLWKNTIVINNLQAKAGTTEGTEQLGSFN